MLPIKKLYIDSKARTADSRSTTNFAIDLVDSLSMPEGAVFSICDVLVPHTWYLIDAGRNNNLYFYEAAGQNPGGVAQTRLFSIALDSGNYDGQGLANAIQAKISAVTTYYSYAVSFDTLTDKLVIHASINSTAPGAYQWNVLTDTDVTEVHSITSTPNSLNTFLGNTAKFSVDQNPLVSPPTHYESSRLQFNPIKYLLIKSSNLGTFNTLGSFGERTILKKVPVNAPQGEMILDVTRSGNDYLECGKQTLKRLEFTITDERGNIPDLHEHDVSFSLIFSVV